MTHCSDVSTFYCEQANDGWALSELKLLNGLEINESLL